MVSGVTRMDSSVGTVCLAASQWPILFHRMLVGILAS